MCSSDLHAGDSDTKRGTCVVGVHTGLFIDGVSNHTVAPYADGTLAYRSPVKHNTIVPRVRVEPLSEAHAIALRVQTRAFDPLCIIYPSQMCKRRKRILNEGCGDTRERGDACPTDRTCAHSVRLPQ